MIHFALPQVVAVGVNVGVGISVVKDITRSKQTRPDLANTNQT